MSRSSGEPIGNNASVLSARWGLSIALSRALVDLDRWARRTMAAERVRWPGLTIISGHRSRSLQSRVNPDAPGSLHVQCPALAADLRVGDAPASFTPREVWAFLGTRWQRMGNRWGGSFREPDYNHFDLGLSLIETVAPRPRLPTPAPIVLPRTQLRSVAAPIVLPRTRSILVAAPRTLSPTRKPSKAIVLPRTRPILVAAPHPGMSVGGRGPGPTIPPTFSRPTVSRPAAVVRSLLDDDSSLRERTVLAGLPAPKIRPVPVSARPPERRSDAPSTRTRPTLRRVSATVERQIPRGIIRADMIDEPDEDDA